VTFRRRSRPCRSSAGSRTASITAVPEAVHEPGQGRVDIQLLARRQ
jgi:hypothetical protein